MSHTDGNARTHMHNRNRMHSMIFLSVCCGTQCQSAQRNLISSLAAMPAPFFFHQAANSMTVNTGDLKVAAAVSWPHTLHFVAQGRFGGVVGGLSGRVPGCLSGTLSSSSFSFSSSSASLSGYGSGSCSPSLLQSHPPHRAVHQQIP